jgi:hypothetical protein
MFIFDLELDMFETDVESDAVREIMRKLYVVPVLKPVIEALVCPVTTTVALDDQAAPEVLY